MKSYGEFADIYDNLMHKDINYNHIADYIENLFDYYEVSPKIVCDLACGTGNITIPLSDRGYDMIGVDKSYDMLDTARRKQHSDILFLNQDMASLDLYGSCGAFLCMIDGINYILLPKQLENLFYKIKNCFMDKDGIFIFDISTKHKLKNTIGNNTFIHDDGNIFYVWENKYFDKQDLIRMDLSFFKRNKSLWKRFDEVHLQRAYTKDEIICMLKKAGFNKIDTYSAFTFDEAKAEDERTVFAAR